MAEASIAAPPGINRREFLFYVWGASLALFTAQATGLIIWFMLPRFREGEFGGLFPLENIRDILPSLNSAPVNNAKGRFWLVNVDSSQPNDLMYKANEDPAEGVRGVAAIYTVCTHLGCIYAWNSATNRFECPCHGSKFRLDGRRIETPAPRDLDRFKILAYDADDTLIAESEQDSKGGWMPLVLPDNAVRIRIDTGNRKDGSITTPLCTIQGSC
jgi:cytochrome b6-f complex iron-sulfur subunit